MTRIAIAGAGIAGLTTALALAAEGIDVALFDAAAVLSETGAGLQLSPNATRVLRGLGLLDALDATALRPACVRIRRGRDGATLTSLPLGDAAEARYGAPFLVMHRADLQAALLAAVQAEPRIILTLGERVELIAEDPEGLSVSLTPTGDTGATLRAVTADGLVGADGLHSRVRPLVAASAPDPLRFSGRTAWRSLVPADRVPDHARLPASNLWLGRDAHLVHYPVRGGAWVNVVAIVDAAWPANAERESWVIPGDAAKLTKAFAGWCREARGLLEAAADWRVWPLFDRDPLPRWSRGAVMLAGDAAHPMLPFLAQGSAQAIADAAAIAGAMRAAPSVAAAAAAYERARRPLADRVQRESRRQGVIYHLAPPAALARDAAFRWLGPARMLGRYDWLYGR